MNAFGYLISLLSISWEVPLGIHIASQIFGHLLFSVVAICMTELQILQ